MRGTKAVYRRCLVKECVLMGNAEKKRELGCLATLRGGGETIIRPFRRVNLRKAVLT